MFYKIIYVDLCFQVGCGVPFDRSKVKHFQPPVDDEDEDNNGNHSDIAREVLEHYNNVIVNGVYQGNILLITHPAVNSIL